MMNVMTGRGEPPSVLLVDPESRHREQIQQAFEQYGRLDPAANAMRLSMVETLQQARSALEGRVYDLVIASRQLPDGDGIELLPPGGNAPYPVLITSNRSGEGLAVEAMKAGAIDYIVKSDATLAALPEVAAVALQAWGLMQEHQNLQNEVAEIPRRQQHQLGRELHDGLGQQLTGMGLLARSLVKRLAGTAPQEQQIAEQLARSIDQALSDVRTLSHGLIPVPMDARGLVSALEALARRVSAQSGIKISLQHENPILISDNETATHVYRIVQEAINNAVKHARASEITLILEADEHEAVIEIRDDGTGLPEDLHERQGLGMRTMFHRCRLFGGSLDIYTHDDGGTRVRCCFPLNPAGQVAE
ncbi:MAG TPA: response regulator [Thiolapillus brandeum]|uniref:Response regulator n=1 Tax=Thiolapillus brandeum TaxID=1076588 RepID=A0A831RY16_9GAMM|nr:response regulator [Thiolapillus brandeum]